MAINMFGKINIEMAAGHKKFCNDRLHMDMKWTELKREVHMQKSLRI